MPFLRKYGTGTGSSVFIPMVKRGVVDFAVSADWTPAGGDVKVSIDGAAAASIGTLPTAVTMGNTAMWKFVFADAELQGKRIMVTIADSATKAVEDQMFEIETYGNASAMYQWDMSAANLPAQLGNVAHGGAASTLELGSSSSTPALYVHNSGGDASQFTSTGGNGHGVIYTGAGGGDGLHAIGGATGNGIKGQGGGTSGSGLHVSAQTGGDGITAIKAGAGKDINGVLTECTLVDTTTTNSDMRGTDNAALAATALSTAQWTNTLATNLGTLAGHDPGATLATGAEIAALNDLSATQVENAVWDATEASHLTSGTTGAALNAAGSAGDPWATSLPGSYASGTAGKILATIGTVLSGITSLAQWLGLIAGKQTGDSTARSELRATGAGSGTFDETADSLEAIRTRGDTGWVTATGFATSADVATIEADIAACQQAGSAVTLPTTAPANWIDAAAIATSALDGKGDWATSTALATLSSKIGTPVGASIAADIATNLAKWTTAVTESYAADGAAPTPEQALMMILQSVQEFGIASTTRTVRKLDKSTAAMTFTLNDATNPTDTTRAT